MLDPKDNQTGFEERWAESVYLQAKIVIDACRYIINNLKKVSDWSDLTLSIESYDFNSKTNRVTLFYTHRPFEGDKEYIILLNKSMCAGHNPIRTIEDPVFDSIDGDFSLKINGEYYNFINAAAIINIASFIEYQLANEIVK